MARVVTRAAVAAIALAAFLFVGFYVVDAGIQTSRHDISIVNESFDPVGGEINVLNNSQLNRADYESTVTVYNESDGSKFPTANYTWHSSNGTIFVNNNSDLDNASTALIEYNYTGQTLKQTKTTNVLVEFMGVLVPLAFIAFVSMLAVAMFFTARFT